MDQDPSGPRHLATFDERALPLRERAASAPQAHRRRRPGGYGGDEERDCGCNPDGLSSRPSRTPANNGGSIAPLLGQKSEAPVQALDADGLLVLLQIYEAALAELRTMGDLGVAPLMRRLERRRGEAVAALAALWFPED
jgi:hypothetical protein